MTDLPRDRMSEAALFTFYGVDMFRPFVVKNGHKELKRYGALYTFSTHSHSHYDYDYFYFYYDY